MLRQAVEIAHRLAKLLLVGHIETDDDLVQVGHMDEIFDDGIQRRPLQRHGAKHFVDGHEDIDTQYVPSGRTIENQVVQPIVFGGQAVA